MKCGEYSVTHVFFLTTIVTNLFKVAAKTNPTTSTPAVSLDLFYSVPTTSAPATAVCESCLKNKIFVCK